MSILAVITTFLAAFAAICSAAMVFSGFLGLLDMDDLVPAKPRDQLSRMVDMFCLGGLLWVVGSLRRNWARHNDDRESIRTGLGVGAVSICPAVAAVLLSRFSS